ncbi:MAG TPA: hypothetical protein VKZ39_02580 [Sphaerochaetaceae bacterium]|nr:hypothetical protein [Sphaerochaetaceae bacterium]
MVDEAGHHRLRTLSEHVRLIVPIDSHVHLIHGTIALEIPLFLQIGGLVSSLFAALWLRMFSDGIDSLWIIS